MSASTSPPPAASVRARAIIAAALALGLIAAVLLLALGGSDDEDSVTVADPECLSLWNDDAAAVQLGRHQSTFHRYTSVQVLRLNLDDGSFPPDPAGTCAIAYAATSPATEPEAAAQVYSDGRWVGLNEIDGATPEVLARLQSEAVAGANAGVDEQGRINPY